jgi:hypothetical protein
MDANKRWIAGDTLPSMALAFPPPLKWGCAVSCMHCAMAMAFLDPYQLLLSASEKKRRLPLSTALLTVQRFFGSRSMHNNILVLPKVPNILIYRRLFGQLMASL